MTELRPHGYVGTPSFLKILVEKAAETGQLAKIAEAVDFVAPNMGHKVASLTNDENRLQGGSSELERFVLGGVG